MLVKSRRIRLATVALSAFTLAATLVRGEENPYHFLKAVPVGGEGGWDCLSVDSAARRLYVSHATKVVVIDLDKETVVGEITNTPGVHGIAVAPELGLGITSNGRENKAGIVDLKTLQTLSKVDTGQNPDGMLYNPGQKEAYLFNGRGQSATVVDVKSAKVVATIPLRGRPEFAAVDTVAGRVYDNLEDKSEVVVIDAKSHQVVTNWPIAPGEGASGMAIDLAHHRLFLGCGGSKTMVMMDSETGKVLATVPIGSGVDANAFDPETQLAFASCGDGTVTIAHEDAPDKLTVVQTLTTERGSRTMALDPKTHKIYLPSAKFEAPAEGQRRVKMVPDSFKILVYGMEKTPVRADAAQAKFRDTFNVDKAALADKGKSTYMILEPGYKLIFQSGKDTLTITVLDETKVVDGVKTRIVEERETKGGKLEEVSRNYFAIDKATGDIYYFGEDVDMYDASGKVTGHEGSWLSGVNEGEVRPGHARQARRGGQVLPGSRAEGGDGPGRSRQPHREGQGSGRDVQELPEDERVERPGEWPAEKLYAPGVGLLKDGGFKLANVEMPHCRMRWPRPSKPSSPRARSARWTWTKNMASPCMTSSSRTGRSRRKRTSPPTAPCWSLRSWSTPRPCRRPP